MQIGSKLGTHLNFDLSDATAPGATTNMGSSSFLFAGAVGIRLEAMEGWDAEGCVGFDDRAGGGGGALLVIPTKSDAEDELRRWRALGTCSFDGVSVRRSLSGGSTGSNR